MDLFKAQFDRIQKQLAGLTASQKMLTATLVAIMVMTLVWWGHYAGEAEMEPVLDQSFTQEDIGRITNELTARHPLQRCRRPHSRSRGSKDGGAGRPDLFPVAAA